MPLQVYQLPSCSGGSQIEICLVHLRTNEALERCLQHNKLLIAHAHRDSDDQCKCPLFKKATVRCTCAHSRRAVSTLQCLLPLLHLLHHPQSVSHLTHSWWLPTKKGVHERTMAPITCMLVAPAGDGPLEPISGGEGLFCFACTRIRDM